MQSKITNICLIISITSVLVACNNKADKSDKTTTTDSSKQVVVDSSENRSATPKLFCRSLGEDSLATPQADVILSVGGTEKKIGSINACNDIPPAEYKTYDIPADAISACGGWWAGAGSYFYLVLKDGKYVVFEGWNEEGQKDKGFHWKEVTSE